MKKWGAALLMSLAVATAAEAQKYIGTPAQDLFDQASFYVEFNYNGFSTTNIANLVAKYQSQIDELCTGQAQSCPFDVARRPIANMVRELQDPHSYFIPADVVQQFSGQLNGGGTGTPSLELNTAKLRGVGDRVITDVREDGPAGKAGLKRGDRITSINGQALPATRSSNESLIPNLEGRGQPIRFGIVRGGSEKLEITVTPELVKTAWLPEGKTPSGLPSAVAFIRIHEFSPYKEVGVKFHELVNAAEKAGASSIVVDLRDNPGGVATECTSAPGAFLEEVTNTLERRYSKTVYRYKNGLVSGGNGQKMSEVYSVPNPAQFKGKVAVLVNAESASCGEVFPAHIQYAKRGIVVGEETYGILNTATSFFDLADGSLLGLTIARSLRPDGQPFAERVKPDVAFDEDLEALANGRDAMLEKALEALGTKSATHTVSKPNLPKELRAYGGL
jgi:carboxyl-terminal processing protease